MEMILKNGRVGVMDEGVLVFLPAISGGSDFTASRLGQYNGSGSALALFYKQFAGEVMTTFAAQNVLLAKTMVRNIKQGKSAAFPATGVVNAHYHIPGTELTGQTTKATERLISIDSLLVADVFIPNIDEAMAQYEVRSIYSHEAGVSLADQMDLNLFRVLCLAGRASSTITGLNGGTVVTASTADVNGAALAAAIYSVAQAFDEKKVPAEGRFVGVKPAQYYLMAQNTDLINKDWTGGNGDIAKGTIGSVGGIEVVKSIHVPTEPQGIGPRGGAHVTEMPQRCNSPHGPSSPRVVWTKTVWNPDREGYQLQGKEGIELLRSTAVELPAHCTPR